ncbi:Nn.00g048800.m01.CDS01 [Neocucurbitaria sp. VM-36]
MKAQIKSAKPLWLPLTHRDPLTWWPSADATMDKFWNGTVQKEGLLDLKDLPQGLLMDEEFLVKPFGSLTELNVAGILIAGDVFQLTLSPHPADPFKPTDVYACSSDIIALTRAVVIAWEDAPSSIGDRVNATGRHITFISGFKVSKDVNFSFDRINDIDARRSPAAKTFHHLI